MRQALGGYEEVPDDWVTTATVIRETGREVFVCQLDRGQIRSVGGGTRKNRSIFRKRG